MWKIDDPQGDETGKVRHRVIKYCQGIGLDMGPGDMTVTTNAIGVGLGGAACALKVDLSIPDHLAIFSEGYFDFVFSSHALEDLQDTESALKEWWRVLMPSGYLILYLPHEDLYPRVGQPGANPRHKHDFNPQKILHAMEKIGTYQIVENSTHNEDREYSFLLVLRKLPGVLGEVKAPAKPKPEKKACLVRYGGWGDAVACSPVLQELKRRGYHVTFNTTGKGHEVMRHDPSVDEFLIQTKDQVPPAVLEDYWAKMAKEYDLFINLSRSMEVDLLFRGPDLEGKTGGKPIDADYDLPHAERHAKANINYMDYLLDKAGMPELKGIVPTMAFSEEEERAAACFRNKHKDEFLVVMVLGGSANHKHWVHAEACGRELLDRYPDARIITMGETLYKIWEWDHPRVMKRCGQLTFRNTALMANNADLVIAPETGVAWAVAGNPRTRQIVYLSHSSAENLTRDWPNTATIAPKVQCHPCHQLHYRIEDCPTDSIDDMALGKGWLTRYPICVTRLAVDQIMEHVEDAHLLWKLGRPVERKELVA